MEKLVKTWAKVVANGWPVTPHLAEVTGSKYLFRKPSGRSVRSLSDGAAGLRMLARLRICALCCRRASGPRHDNRRSRGPRRAIDLNFREFLHHKIPAREIIVGHYRGLRDLQQAGERVGVVVRHGWEHLYRRDVPPYNGDESFPSPDEGNKRSVPARYHELYVANCGVVDPRVTALPRGVDHHHYPWRLVLARSDRPKPGLAYCNFSLGSPTQPRYWARRVVVYRMLKDRDWITFENMGNRHGVYDISSFQFYRRLDRHRFTISPEGNGIDCYRTWEALYLRSIPIVQRSTEMEHFSDLPILFTDDYGELTPDYLEDQYARMLETDYRIEKLYLSHWKRRLEDSIRRQSAAPARATKR